MINTTRKGVVITPSALASLDGYEIIQPNLIISDLYHVDIPLLIGSYTSSNAGMVKAFLDVIARCETSTLGVRRDDEAIQINGDGSPYSSRKLELKVVRDDELKNTLSLFKWVGRRMEMIGKIGEKIIYSDYGHHAPALEGNIKALQEQFPNKKICAIFQPHQAQRVLAGREDFQQALLWVDTTIIYRLYTAREDFQSLCLEYPRLALVSNFDELWQQFAEDLHADYLTDIATLKWQLYDLSDDYIIVYFSAGDLDEEMRSII